MNTINNAKKLEDLWQDGGITVEKAVARFSISRTQLYSLMDQGKIVWTKPAGRRIIAVSSIVKLLAAESRGVAA